MAIRFKKVKKGSLQNIIFFVILAGSIIIIAGFLFIANWKVSQRRSELNSRIEELREEIQFLEGEKEELQAKISESLDYDYLEKEARDRFNLKKPGEEVVTILPPEEKEQIQAEEEKPWWNLFDW